MKKLLICVALLLVLSGCKVSTLLPLATGNYWYLTDQASGHVTKFTITELRDIGCYGPAYNLYISKEHTEDYWAPSYDLNINFYVKYLSNGLLISPASITVRPDGTTTLSTNYHQSGENDPIPYILTTSSDKYIGTMLNKDYHGLNYTCMKPGDEGVTLGGQDGLWRVFQSLKYITTPVFNGLGYCFRYSEGTSIPQAWDTNGENNAEEWCFAPKVGLVQLTNLHYHYAGIDYSTGCVFDNLTNPSQLAGVDWVACTAPNVVLKPKHIPNMVLKLTQYKVN